MKLMDLTLHVNGTDHKLQAAPGKICWLRYVVWVISASSMAVKRAIVALARYCWMVSQSIRA